jgi:hypothetical protein
LNDNRGSKKLQNGSLVHWLHEASSPTRSGVRMALATNLADFLGVLSILRLAVAVSVAAAARCHDSTFIFPAFHCRGAARRIHSSSVALRAMEHIYLCGY